MTDADLYEPSSLEACVFETARIVQANLVALHCWTRSRRPGFPTGRAMRLTVRDVLAYE
jgi:predicted Rdx family selenoprotein